MSRMRQMVQRGKQVPLEEIENLYAVRSPTVAAQDSDDGKTSEDNSALNPDEVAAIWPELPPNELRAFQDAGWRFIQSDQPPQAGDGKVARVVVKPGGRVALATNRLTLQVADPLSEPQTKALLAEHSSRLVGELKFAKGLYEVAVDQNQGKNVLDVAAELNALPDVKFAEPQFVEVLSGRDGSGNRS
jgi:hypothetical protein